MKVLVIGSGGREHALCWRLAKSPSITEVHATPGNPGMKQIGATHSTDGTPTSYANLAESLKVDFTVVGPEAPLASGVCDEFRRRGLPIVGPNQAAAQLEASKAFAKDVMIRAGIPTARHITVSDAELGIQALSEFSLPVVLKADGLAAGKGVVIAQTYEEAKQSLVELMSGHLVGDAGTRVVIEEFLVGEEVSFIVLTDGETVVPFMPTQDHKAIFDGDLGPNTGGMGAYCDSRILSDDQTDLILSTVVEPTLRTLRESGTPFHGFLYAGLMMTASGPKVLEFNARLGDPETQALLYRINSDLGELLYAAATNSLAGHKIRWSEKPSVCIVLAAAGYPGKVKTGDPIYGISEAETTGAAVFHAGTKQEGANIVTSGGRVLGVTHSGPTLPEAIENAYRATHAISFEGMQIRTDIGKKGLKRW